MLVLPLAERFARAVLRGRGVASRRLTTSVGALHAFDARSSGALPPVAVLHGFGSSASAFAPVLARLAPRCRRVFAPEAPGHGFSDPPAAPLTFDAWRAAITEALDAELDEPAVVVGNSLGGATALRYALDRPDRVRALVLASPAGAPCDDAELDALVRSFRLASAADARRFMRRLYHRAPWYAPLLARDVHESFTRPMLKGLLEAVDPADLFRADELASLRMPILLLWGRSERLLPSSGLDFFRGALPPHAIVEEPEGMGHCPHVDDPAAFARRIAAFAGSLSG